MSSANCCEFVFTGSAGRLRLDRVFVGTLVSSGSSLPAPGISDELELDEELDELALPELPASCKPPGGVGVTSPAPEDEEVGEAEDDPGCSPGYGNRCAGLFVAAGAPGVC
jgi:hypothetical protein